MTLSLRGVIQFATGVILVAALLAAGPAAEEAVKEVSTPLPDDVLVVAAGIEEAIGTLEQVVGHATFRRESETERTRLDFDFWLDGTRIRWDTRTVGEQVIEGHPLNRAPFRQEAYDGGRGYQAYYFSLEEDPGVYVHAPEDMAPVINGQAYSGFYTGIAFSPKGFYIPQGLSFASPLRSALEQLAGSGAEISVRGDLSSAESVVLRIESGRSRIDLTVNIAEGFVITREENFFDGQSTDVVIRDYRRDSAAGAVLLTRLVKEPTPVSDLLQEVEIVYDQVNEPIPADEFTLAGFGLPRSVSVKDLARDITYKFLPLEDIASELEDIVRVTDSSSALRAEGEGGPAPGPDANVNGEVRPREVLALEPGDRHWGAWAWPCLVAATVLGLLVIWIRARKHTYPS